MYQLFVTSFIVNLLFQTSLALERELTINIEPRKEDCFYQTMRQGDMIDVEYQVIDGGHGDLDITFHLADPTGRILIADSKKSENNHRMTGAMDGDYKFCFDNTFSAYNSKTVFFEFIVENDSEPGSDEHSVYPGFRPEDIYDIQVQDIQTVISNVKNDLNKVRHMQELIKSTEARDRNVAEENNFKVTTFSIFQICVMFVVGSIQVIMVRSLFDETSKMHKVWKNLKR